MFAHQDDEFSISGTIRKLSSNSWIVWVTNGDGPAPALNLPPDQYAAERIMESFNVAKHLNIPEDRRKCYQISEIENYREFIIATQGEEGLKEAISWFKPQYQKIYEEIAGLKPDVVWTNAFQGGNPEHDLVHFLTALALRRLRKEINKEIQLREIPQYELTILVALRFAPWYKAEKYFSTLDDEEFEKKIECALLYPTQEALLKRFRTYINFIGKFGYLLGKGFDYKDYLKKEYFAIVPQDRNYLKPPYSLKYFNYMFDHYQGKPVYFHGMLETIFRRMLQELG